MRGLVFIGCLFLAACSPGCRGKGKDSKDGKGARATAGGGGADPESPQGAARSRAYLNLDAKIPPPPSSDAPTEAPPEFDPPAGPGSFRVVRPVSVYRGPSTEAKIVGAIAKFTRIARVVRVAGQGCSGGFLKLASFAYVCANNLVPDRRPPMAVAEPALGANRLTPGTYGYIRTGGAKLYWLIEDAFHDRKGVAIRQSDTVRWAGKRFFQGRKFWRITTGHFIRGDRVRRFWPSRFKGVDLAKSGKKLPLVFMVSVRRRKIGEKIPPVPVHAAPEGAIIAHLPRYTAWPVDRVAWRGDARWFHIPEKGWVASELTRLARYADPPRAAMHPDERWIDVNLDENTLVAYRGRAPVYATVVAAGVWKYPTPRGVFRIYKKKAEADMKSEQTADEKYRVDHVPWTMYFKGGYALHGTYWHNGFGHSRSHGCVNLSPRDARFLYHWSRPSVPDGWTLFVADDKHPGTLVRIGGAKPRPPKAQPVQVPEDARRER